MTRISGIRIRALACLAIVTFLFGGGVSVYAEKTSSETRRIDSIINKVLNAYGGRQAVEEISSLHAKGKIAAFMLGDEGTYELYFKRGKKLRVETKYANSSELRILDGHKGYRSTDKLPFEEVDGPRLLSMLYQYKHLNILHDLSAGKYDVRSAGRATVADKETEVFRVTDKEGAVMDVFIDTGSSFILKVVAYFSSGNKQIDLSSEFSDFRRVGKNVFPFRITNYAGGLKVAQTVIDDYSINPEIPDYLFLPSAIQTL